MTMPLTLLVLAAVLVVAGLIGVDVVRDDPRYLCRQLRHVRVEDGRIVASRNGEEK